MKENLFLLTLDTDWCSEELLEWTLSLIIDLELSVTVFATGSYECLEHDNTLIEVGLHPNFSRSEDHQREVEELREIYPQAVSVRSHRLFEYSGLLEIYRLCGLKWDSTPLMYLCDNIKPFRHPSGLMRLPIFWEDDDYLDLNPDWNLHNLRLDKPGIKCFDFHPIHLRLNSWSLDQYEYVKNSDFPEDAIIKMEYKGRDKGVLSIFHQLAEYIEKNEIQTCKIRDICKWD